MAFNIKDEQAVARLRELAEIEGTSMTAAASKAFEDALSKSRRKGLSDRLMEIAAEACKHADPEWLAKTQQEMDDEVFDPETGLPW
jgi:hypothetical protein